MIYLRFLLYNLIKAKQDYHLFFVLARRNYIARRGQRAAGGIVVTIARRGQRAAGGIVFTIREKTRQARRACLFCQEGWIYRGCSFVKKDGFAGGALLPLKKGEAKAASPRCLYEDRDLGSQFALFCILQKHPTTAMNTATAAIAMTATMFPINSGCPNATMLFM